MKKQKKEHIYIIGIGGKGLNSIAEFCLSQEYTVSGSDTKESSELEALKEKGISIYLDQCGIHIDETFDCIVYSSVILEDHPERIRARELGIKQMSRAQFLGHITRTFTRICVAGSHGKSTTSALATLALRAQEGNVNSITGAYIKELGSYQSSGESEYCVLEACEYAKSFLQIPGDYTLITSLEKSHMEYFGDEQSMNKAFEEFVNVHKPDATLIINGDVPALRNICGAHTGRVITCGFNQSNDYVLKEIRLHQLSSVFSLYRDDVLIEKDIVIKIPGTYNILNVALVYALLHTMRLSTKSFAKVLDNFSGVGRRFELKTQNQTTFVDDFAHHPTQVKNLLSSIRQFFPQQKILAVFEPRQYHLFKTFLKEYGAAFKCADEVYVTDIVPALGDTEKDIAGLNVSDVINSMKIYSKPQQIWYEPSYQGIADKIAGQDLTNVVIATIGAGPIFRVRDLLLNSVK